MATENKGDYRAMTENCFDESEPAVSNRLRVLSVLHYPFFGGPQNQNMRLHPVLAQAGVDLRAVLPDEPGDAASRLRDAGVPTTTQRLRRLRATADLRTQVKFALSFWPDVLRLKRLIQQQGIDVVQINGLENPHGATGATRRSTSRSCSRCFGRMPQTTM